MYNNNNLDSDFSPAPDSRNLNFCFNLTILGEREEMLVLGKTTPVQGKKHLFLRNIIKLQICYINAMMSLCFHNFVKIILIGLLLG